MKKEATSWYSMMDQMPGDVASEIALLSSIIQDPGAAKATCLDIVKAEWFKHPGCKKLLRGIQELSTNSDSITTGTLEPYVDDSFSKADINILFFGKEYTDPSALMTHFGRVLDVYRRRVFWEEACWIFEHASKTSGKVLRARLQKMTERADMAGALPGVARLETVLEKHLKALKGEGSPGEKYSTELPQLDRLLLGGLRGGGLYIVAGRPSMGKTTFALNLAMNLSASNHSVLLVSLEQSDSEIASAALSRGSGVSASVTSSGQFFGKELPSDITDAAEQLKSLPLYLCDESYVTLSSLRTLARKLKGQHGLDCLVVDYLQLLESEDPRQARHLQISSLSRGLKLLARELDIPIILLSQLSRAVEAREDKKPLLSDLRESGAIEQDADVVLFLFRPGYYDDQISAEDTELIIAKHRGGPIGKIQLYFKMETSTFYERLE